MRFCWKENWLSMHSAHTVASSDLLKEASHFFLYIKSLSYAIEYNHYVKITLADLFSLLL